VGTILGNWDWGRLAPRYKLFEIPDNRLPYGRGSAGMSIYRLWRWIDCVDISSSIGAVFTDRYN
jgi:hypothetical protein